VPRVHLSCGVLNRALIWGVLSCGVLAGHPAAADTGQAEALYELMEMPDLLGVMRQEGLKLGADMAEEYFPNRVVTRFDARVQQIYDVATMDGVMRGAFVSGLESRATDAQMAQLIAFFSEGAGVRLVPAELTARRDFLDDGIEDAAETHGEDIAARDPELARLIGGYIAANDLVEQNVSGALTANYNFYLGLVEGGGYDIDETQILSDVWEQEEATRADSARWLNGYLLQAYGGLARADLQAYVDLSRSDAGAALNQVLFDGFGMLYNNIYRALGQSISSLMSGQEL
jgi:hypothetical protein